MTAPILVLGWGNLSRGDDALGPLCVAALHDSLPASMGSLVEFLDDHQLNLEHALDLTGRTRVLLIDASLTCRPPFEVTLLQPEQDDSFTTHTLSPQALLHIYQNLHDMPPPHCTLLAIRGSAFELGTPPGSAALDHLDSALQWARAWLTGTTDTGCDCDLRGCLD